MKDWRTQEHVGLKVEADGHTAVVTLNNPPAHTDRAQPVGAARPVGALNADRDIYALVITGNGEVLLRRCRPQPVRLRRQGRCARGRASLR